MSESVSRRDFIKVTTGIVGGIIGAALGLPAVYYLIDPALRPGGKEAWIPIGKPENMEIGKPYAFSFTRVQVNGWERTATSHGGFALRRSEDPAEIMILNSQCTHLACTVNWNEQAQAYLCPCHDAKFSLEGEVLAGPPPRPLNRFTEFRLTDEGTLEIFFSENNKEG